MTSGDRHEGAEVGAGRMSRRVLWGGSKDLMQEKSGDGVCDA